MLERQVGGLGDEQVQILFELELGMVVGDVEEMVAVEPTLLTVKVMRV